MASSLPLLSSAPLLLLLLLLVPSADVARGATPAEVIAAVTAAKLADPELRVAADVWIKFMNSSAAAPDVSGNVTILLPKNFLFIKYNFPGLTGPQTLDLFNMHVITGLLSFNQIKFAPSSTQFQTKNPNETLKRVLYPGGNVYMRVAKAAQGPRRNSEIQAPIPRPDIFPGSSVYVHGFAAVLTPSSFTGGPYQTIPI